VTSRFWCPSELAEALPGRLVVLRLGNTLALRRSVRMTKFLSDLCIKYLTPSLLQPPGPPPSNRAASTQNDVVPALRQLSLESALFQLDFAPAPPDLDQESTPPLPDPHRKENILFLCETMSAIGLEDHLAIKFFSKVYCWLPSHLTVRGLAEDLISAEYDRQKATGGLAGGMAIPLLGMHPVLR